MAHFNFENLVNEVTRMDGDISAGPMARWERKASKGKIDRLDGATPLSPRNIKSAKTPKTVKTPLSAKLKTKTPSKTPGKSQQLKMRSKTPSKDSMDRFIPNRSTTDIDLGYYNVMSKENVEEEEESEEQGASQSYKEHLDMALSKGQNPNNAKILSYQDKAPVAKDGFNNKMKVLYTGSKSAAPKGVSTRQIPQQPERILDAPDLLDDYYLNLLHWSAENLLAVALGGAVYIWNAASGTIAQLLEFQDDDTYISSLAWLNDQSSNILAVGNSTGTVQLWDVQNEKLLRNMGGHAARIGSLSWNSHICSSGSRSGAVHHHDVRVANHHVGSLLNHSQEVCGLAWSPDGRHLASGGNDNVLNIWDASLSLENVQPVHTFTEHQAAVKALSWCPWSTQVLASGGGTADRHIRLWNVTTGLCLSSTDTNSQVSSILWSDEFKEMISGHGYTHNQLTIWKYPQMTKVAELRGHTSRVLCLTMSPDGSTVASAAADETIRIWKCFKSSKKPQAATKPKETRTTIRGGSIR